MVTPRDRTRARLNKLARKPDGYLTTREFARYVDEPIQVILDKHRSGLFPAAVSNSTGGRGRVTYYTIEQVDVYKALKETVHDPITALRVYSAPEAKMGYEALAEGKDARHLVMVLGIHPNRAKAIVADYTEMGGGVVLEAADVERILRLGLSGPTAIRSGADILAILKLAAEEARALCGCERGPRALCLRCAADRARSAAESTEAALLAASAEEAQEAFVEALTAPVAAPKAEAPDPPVKMSPATKARLEARRAAKRKASPPATPPTMPDDEGDHAGPGGSVDVDDPDRLLASAG